MAKVNWARLAIVGAGVILAQTFIGNALNFMPSITGYNLLNTGITLAALATVGIGVFAGEMVAEKVVKN